MRVLVYSLPSCQPCRMTKTMLIRHNISFEDISLVGRPEKLLEFKQWGVTQTPVVEIVDDDGQRIDWWSGFKLAKIRQLSPDYQ